MVKRDKSYEDSLMQALVNPEEAAAYLEAAMELEDKSALLIALRQVAKAHGMAEVARNASLGEKTLFKSLSDDGNPTLDTMNRILHSVGLRLSVAASHA